MDIDEGKTAICVNPNCPHPLHKMSVEEFVAQQKAKAEASIPRS